MSLLCVGSLMAEDDGFFMGATYQTSLAIERVDNPGLVVSQDASNYIRGNAAILSNAATPLTYYLEAMGQQTKLLMKMLCPSATQRCYQYAGGSVTNPTAENPGNNPTRGNHNVVYEDLAKLENDLNSLTQAIGASFANSSTTNKVLEMNLNGREVHIVLPENMFNAMQAVNADIYSALTALWNNQTITNKSFSTPSNTTPTFSSEVTSQIGSALTQQQMQEFAKNAQEIFQALMQASIIGTPTSSDTANPGFVYGSGANGALPSGLNPNDYTKYTSPKINNGTAYYVAKGLIESGLSASSILSNMQTFSEKTAHLTGNSSYQDMAQVVAYGKQILKENNEFGKFVGGKIAPYLSEQDVSKALASRGSTTQTPIKDILKNPQSTQAQGLMATGLGASQAIVNQIVNTMQSKVNNAKAVGFARNFLRNSSQSNNMNGFGVKMGYKQFYGKKRMFGARYYGFMDYGYAQFGNTATRVNANLVTYGVGSDFLYNVFTRKRDTESTDIGLFAGVQLAGQTWSTNFLKQVSGDTNKANTTSFQLLFDLGIRTNFAKIYRTHKSRFSQGLEFGVKIPVFYHEYYKSQGVSAKYLRAFSFYVGYDIGF
ncbi:outer membrane protein [Helicobacter cetorum]|uniref:outer membrane protein n=1 Tax=Helicobacter cetorum TaxID=138563 RepID=UPI002D791F3C|nr:outer membrane protein [Helicobacter cetorum]